MAQPVVPVEVVVVRDGGDQPDAPREAQAVAQVLLPEGLGPGEEEQVDGDLEHGEQAHHRGPAAIAKPESVSFRSKSSLALRYSMMMSTTNTG